MREAGKNAHSRSTWTQEEAELWYARLTNIDLTDEDVNVTWLWMCPNWHEEPFRGYALGFVAYARENPAVQGAVEKLYGPTVHLPALFAYIWRLVSLDKDFSQREDEKRVRERRSSEAVKIRESLSSLIERYAHLTNYVKDNKDLFACLLSPGRYSPPADEWLGSQTGQMEELGARLTKCMEGMKALEQKIWPRLEQPVTNRKVDTFNRYLVFYIAYKMVGNRYWQAMTEIMNAVAHIQGYGHPYDAERLHADYKTLRRNHPDYEGRWAKLIERNQMEYGRAFFDYLRSQGIDAPNIIRLASESTSG